LLIGIRFDFWLQPVVRAANVIGYASGVVFDFSINVPNTRLWRALRGDQDGAIPEVFVSLMLVV
jgi:hypothetical protein